MTAVNDRHEITSYIKHHPVAILGTVDTHGAPHGAAVYVYASSLQAVYIVTKTDTQKFKNILGNPHVSITIADPAENSSLQITGKAHVVKNEPNVIEMVMQNMTKIYTTSPEWLPPIVKLRAGAYQVVSIEVNYARLSEYKGKQPGSTHIFTELHFNGE